MLSIQASHQQAPRWCESCQCNCWWCLPEKQSCWSRNLCQSQRWVSGSSRCCQKGWMGFNEQNCTMARECMKSLQSPVATSVLSRRNICFPLRLLILLTKTALQFSFDHIMVLAASLHFRLREHWTPQLGFFPITQTRRLVFLRVDQKTYFLGLSRNPLRNTSYCSLE